MMPGAPKLRFEADCSGGLTVPADCVGAVMQHIGKDGAEPFDSACMRLMISHATKLLLKTVPCAMIEVWTPEQGQLVVLGDTHGQLEDVLTIFRKNGLPSESNVYLFNGDLVDRGRYAVEILVAALVHKLWKPQCVHIVRGNHEDRGMNASHGFLCECVEKWGQAVGVELYNMFNDLFDHLPLFCLVDDSVFIVHGGLSRVEYTLDDLRSFKFRGPVPEPGFGHCSPPDYLVFDTLWSDPMTHMGFGTSPRGEEGICFGPDVTQKFLEDNDLRLLVRSHELPKNGRGYTLQHQGGCLTIFSASNYHGAANKGSVLLLNRHGEDEIEEHIAPALRQIRTLDPPCSSRFVRVVFKVEYVTYWGQDLFVTGSVSSLGEWNVNVAVPMRWTANHIWEASIDVPWDVPVVEYKYLLRQCNGCFWEGGKNHSITSLPLLSDGFEQYDYWGLGGS